MRTNRCAALITVAMTAVMVVMATAYDSEAQNLHAALWNFGNKCLDFRNGGAMVSDLPEHTFGQYEYDDNWFVDEAGELVLRYSSQEKKLYGKNGGLVAGYEALASKFTNWNMHFVPRPLHPNQVYCFSNVYALVDVEKNELVGDVVDFVEAGRHDSPVIVHSDDCSRIWLVHSFSSAIYCYEVDEGGISYKKKIEIDWPFPKRHEPPCITLSQDCRYYCAVCPIFARDEEPVFYGEFDRRTCEFKRTSLHLFEQSGDRHAYLSSIISPQNKYLYLLVMPDPSGYVEVCDIKRVPIVNSVPDYDNIEFVKRITASGFTYFRYAVDGSLYLCDDGRRCISRVVDVNGANPVFEANILVDDSHPVCSRGGRSQDFISTWVTSDYCYDGISVARSCLGVKFRCGTSAAVKSFRWDFGDGVSSSEASPDHVYGGVGEYDVSVDVEFEDGAVRRFARRVAILPAPGKPAIVPD